MSAMYYSPKTEKIVLLSISGNDIMWEYANGVKFKLSTSHTIFSILNMSYQFIGAFNEN